MTLALLLLSLVLLPPVLILTIETLSALFLPRRSPEAPPNEVEAARCTVLIPAHDEEKVIGETLSSLEKILSPLDRILVVLDNCSDQTASIVARHGVQAVERTDPALPGKGYALDFGLQCLKGDPPDMVVFLDADCVTNEAFLEESKKALLAWKRPVQCLNLMKFPAGSPPFKRVSEFAWFFRSYIRQLGLAKLGLPCNLQGTGMAFLWNHLEGIQLSGPGLVEDMKLGLDLAGKRRFPCFHPRAFVQSSFPMNPKGLETQRRRWEHGHLGLILRLLPGHILDAVRSWNLPLLALCMDLAVPPLALLAIILSSAALAALLPALEGSPAPLILVSSELFLLAGTVFLFWLKWGRSILRFGELLSIPRYVLSKRGLYLKFLWDKQKTWVRTDRS